jgi:hypothetical protein
VNILGMEGSGTTQSNMFGKLRKHCSRLFVNGSSILIYKELVAKSFKKRDALDEAEDVHVG